MLDQSDSTQKAQLRTQSLPVLAQALDIQGDVQLETGQAEQALITWQRAASVYNQVGDVSGLAQSQLNQAQALRELGYYRRALTILSTLRQTLQKQPDAMTTLNELRSLGNALRLVGDLDQSRAVLQQSLNLAKQLPPSPAASHAISSILVGSGNTARAQQDNAAAIAFYQQAATFLPPRSTKFRLKLIYLAYS